MKKTKYYMHTIDGRMPAMFNGKQIVHAYIRSTNQLATSLKQIRTEQKKQKDFSQQSDDGLLPCAAI